MAELILSPLDEAVRVNKRNLTCGNWQTECEAEEELVRFLDRLDLFVYYRQVVGEPLWKHHFQAYHSLRADFLLLPDRHLLKRGWHFGAIVIESKRSGEKIGTGLNQLLDYTNAAFYPYGNVAIVPSFGFLFPALPQVEAVASIMAQQHLGSAYFENANLHFECGHSRMLTVFANGNILLGKDQPGRGLGRR